MAVRRVRSRQMFLPVAVAAVTAVGLVVPGAAGAATAHRTVGRSLSSARTSVSRGAPRPGTWAKISHYTGGGTNEPGLVRTGDGRLHVVWPFQSSSTYGIGYSTISGTGSVLGWGTVVSNWNSIQNTPKLVRNGAGIRLIFNGGQDSNPANPYSRNARYSETSTNGTTWSPEPGSLSSHTAFNSSLAATTESDFTPVSSEGFGGTEYYHIGRDSSVPAATPDLSFTSGTAYFLGNATMVRDAKTNAIYEGFYRFDNTKGTGYYVKELLPTVAAAQPAPYSNDQGHPDSEPRQGVALAARAGGGVYLAYCQPSKTLQCAKVDLWRVGGTRVLSVPGSSKVNATHVTLSSGPGGRMIVGYFDGSHQLIRIVRTNTSVTRFSSVRTLRPPVKTVEFFDGLFTQGSMGRIDVLANVQSTQGVAFYHTQVLVKLGLRTNHRTVAYRHRTRVTFTVTDAGQAVSGATVRFLGRSVKTNRKGYASFTVSSTTSRGRHTASAGKANYTGATTTVTVR